jgi:uncharacterized membrane protein HdeD (DUF308 family)
MRSPCAATFTAAVLVVSGILRLVLAYRRWPVGGSMLILSGVIAVLAGLVIITGWPASGLVVLGICLGLDLLTFGLFRLVLAFALRELRA